MALIPLIKKLLLYEDLLLEGRFGIHLFRVLYEWVFVNVALFLSVVTISRIFFGKCDLLLCSQIYSSPEELILLMVEF